MSTASTKQPGNLSQSALSYLQSLEKETKALRQTAEKKESATTPNVESRRVSSRRGSLSHMISELRHKTRRESTIDESEDDKSISERPTNRSSAKTSSIESSSSNGGERIVFDFPFDGGKKNEASMLELPDLQVGRKSISELRELRTSIDHSLIKPPSLQKQQQRRLSITSYKESFETVDTSGIESEEGRLRSEQKTVKAKSPFRATVESGSDLESLDFEEDLPKPKAVRFEEPQQLSSSSSTSNSSSSTSGSLESSQSKSASTASSHSSSSTSGSSVSANGKTKTSSKSTSGSSSSDAPTPRQLEEASSGSSVREDYKSDLESSSSSGSSLHNGEPLQAETKSLEKEKNHRKTIAEPVGSGSEPVTQADFSRSEAVATAKDSSRIKANRSESKPVEEASPNLGGRRLVGEIEARSSELFMKKESKAVAIDFPPSMQVNENNHKRSRKGRSASRAQHRRSLLTDEPRFSNEGNHRHFVRSPNKSSDEVSSAASPAYMHTIKQSSAVESGTQTDQHHHQQRLNFPEFCSSNLHQVTNDVLRTHLQLLREFNQMEWMSLQEWNAILDDIRERYDGPSTQKLKALIDKRAKMHIV